MKTNVTHEANGEVRATGGMDRREFLRRAAYAGAGLAASTAVSQWAEAAAPAQRMCAGEESPASTGQRGG